MENLRVVDFVDLFKNVELLLQIFVFLATAHGTRPFFLVFTDHFMLQSRLILLVHPNEALKHLIWLVVALIQHHMVRSQLVDVLEAVINFDHA